ncbi:hypothetical protein CHS0354_035206 [Potamilus streckersoni]|uniref:DUF1365 domain-containing protein n=1 Tax=Potamilus streckersoni TaxID=2493646 RepID=A0AAE0S2K0_9BIVA|nr:hypothetical protein CHS0354_035206 [Potamilus streckersoni]
MQTGIYEGKVVHHRKHPREHRFEYSLFMFCLELDETAEPLTKNQPFIGHNRFNLFGLYNRDHFEKTDDAIRLKLIRLIKERGYDYRPGRIFMIANLRYLGYVFNPVTFYFLFDGAERPYLAVAEVHNTFGEIKSYVLDSFDENSRKFRGRHPAEIKTLYPDDDLMLIVNEADDRQLFFFSHLTGKYYSLKSSRLLYYAFKYPFITLKIITLIHFEAVRIYLKKIPFFRKEHKQTYQNPDAATKK